MKWLLFIVQGMFLCLSSICAQSYEQMYKRQPAVDSSYNNKNHNNYQQAFADSADTAKVIGFAVAPLYKKQPESPLGNLMADCMKFYAEKMYNQSVDAAFVNFSGIRSYIPKGDITIGTICKVMPYDNKIVLLTIPGDVLQQFLNHQASLGGWPCAGINMVITGDTATGIFINKKPLTPTAAYTIAVVDYIAKGGNQCTMLKGLQQQNKNYLFRTALIDYVTAFTKAGKPVSAPIENRIVYRKD